MNYNPNPFWTKTHQINIWPLSILIIIVIQIIPVSSYAQSFSGHNRLTLQSENIPYGKELYIVLPDNFLNHELIWEAPKGWLLNGEESGEHTCLLADHSIIVFPSKSGCLNAYEKDGDQVTLVATKMIYVQQDLQELSDLFPDYPLAAKQYVHFTQKIEIDNHLLPSASGIIQPPLAEKTFSLPDFGMPAELEVLDEKGRSIQKMEKNFHPMLLGEKLSAGVYLLKITTQNSVRYARVFKK